MASKNRKKRRLAAKIKRLRRVYGMSDKNLFDETLDSNFWDEYEAEQKRKQEQTQNIVEEYNKKWGFLNNVHNKYLQKNSLCVCKGNKKVFETKNLTVYGGGYTTYAQLIHGGILIDLAGYMSRNIVTVTGFSCPTLKELVEYPTINIEWTDHSTIDWTGEEWKALLYDLDQEAIRQGKKLPVLVSCMGGHGRTGVALTMMAYFSGAIKNPDTALTWIRNIYCQEAVETITQELYVKNLIRWDLEEKEHDK
jgi:hypothetical protein